MLEDIPIHKKIKIELNDLPGEEAHAEMIPFRRLSSLAIKDTDQYRLSAVLIILYYSDGNLHSLLTERQSYNGKHSGQISFPGGKKEDNDESTIHTAIRETYEEIGIKINPTQVLGRLTDVYIPVSNFLVHPYVAWTDQKIEPEIDKREVKSIIEFPIHQLFDTDIRVNSRIQNHEGIWMKDIPSFNIQKKAVWGATALMLNEFRIVLERIKTSF